VREVAAGRKLARLVVREMAAARNQVGLVMKVGAGGKLAQLVREAAAELSWNTC
jgi:hypothetical protein